MARIERTVKTVDPVAGASYNLSANTLVTLELR